MEMEKQRSEEYVTLEHPKHGERKTLSWVAPSLLKKGWKEKKGKPTATQTKEKRSDGKANN